MSQYTPPGIPPYYTPTASLRPASVTTVAVIGIVWGALTLVCNGVAAAAVFSGVVPAGNPIQDELMRQPLLRNFSHVAIVLRVVLALVLLAGSIGVLMLNRTARRALLVFAWLMLLLCVVDVIITVTMTLPILQRHLTATSPQERAGQIAFMVGLVFGVIFGVALPILILWAMNTARAKAAFGVGPEPSAMPPFSPANTFGPPRF